MTAPEPMEAPARKRIAALSLSHILLLGIAFVACDSASYFLQGGTATAVVAVQCLMILLVALFDIRLGITCFAVLLVFADEISRYLYDTSGDSGVTSILTVSAGGIAVANYAALALMLVAVAASWLRWLQSPKAFTFTSMDRAMAAVGLLFGASALLHVGTLLAHFRIAANQLNLPIMACGLYFAMRAAFVGREHAIGFWRIFMAAITAKLLAWTMLAAIGIGSEFGSTLRVGFGSTWTLFVLLLCYCLIIQQPSMQVRRRERALALACAVAAGFLLLLSAGRMLWVLTAASVGIMLLFGPGRAKLAMLLGGGLCVGLGYLALAQFRPESLDTIHSMFSTLRFWDEASVSSSDSTRVRLYELANIHAQLAEKNQLIVGAGPGSAFSDQYYPYPFGVFAADYPVEELDARLFRNPHTLFAFLLLQVGYSGMLVYLAAMAVLWWSCLRAHQKEVHPMGKAIALSLFAFLPCMIYMAWNSKANMLLGILLGMAGVVQASPQVKE